MSDDQQQTKILSDNVRDNIDKNIQDPESLLINIFRFMFYSSIE